MKRFSNLLVALGVTLFLLTVGMKTEAKSQPCTSMLDTLIMDGCPYQVEICVYCGLTYPGYVEIGHIEPLDPNCINTLNQTELIQRAFTQLNTPDALWLEFCQPDLPPCSGTERKLVNWRSPYCWDAKLLFIIPKPYPDPPRYEYYMKPCDNENYCTVQYSYCKDALGVIHYEVNTNFPTGVIDCEESDEVLMPHVIGNTSDCFIFHTPCNP